MFKFTKTIFKFKCLHCTKSDDKCRFCAKGEQVYVRKIDEASPGKVVYDNEPQYVINSLIDMWILSELKGLPVGYDLRNESSRWIVTLFLVKDPTIRCTFSASTVPWLSQVAVVEKIRSAIKILNNTDKIRSERLEIQE